MYIISLHSQTHISSYKTVSSTISLFQRNNLPNTKIRSEKTFSPPANFLFIHPFKSLLKLPPFPRKQASNLNPGKDITDWQSQVSFRRHSSSDLRGTFRVDRMKNPIPRCQLELCRFDPRMENRPFSTTNSPWRIPPYCSFIQRIWIFSFFV